MKISKLLAAVPAALIMPTAVICLGASSVLAGPADDMNSNMEGRSAEIRARMSNQAEDRIDASATLQKATDLYQAIVKGTHGQVPESVLVKAQCVAVLPDLMTGAIVIGGTHGTGVATCKENGNWSAPAFVKMNSLSFGAQLGGKSSDVVLFILNTKAKTALKRGRLSLGADASVVAGTFDKSFDTSTHGAVAYNRTEGAFAGASLSGGTLASDDEDTEAFYGKEVDYISLLEGIVPTKQNDEVDRFRALLPM